MLLKEVLKRLEIDDLPVGAADHWDESQISYVKEAFYLNKDFISHMADVIQMNDELKKAYFDTAEKISLSEEASRFAWFLYHVYCVKKVPPTNDLPVPSRNILGPNERMFVFIVLSPIAAELEKSFETSGIPVKYFNSTMRSMDFQFKLCLDNTGSWGIWHPAWTVNYLNGGVFTVGRFVYRKNIYGGPVRSVLKDKISGKNVLLYDEGYSIRKDGHINGTNDIYEEGCTVTVYKEDEEGITAHTAHDGIVELSVSYFPFERYEKKFSKGDVYLEIHIPSGSRLTNDVVLSSYKEALEFYNVHIGVSPKALICTTWLLDNDFDRLLPPESNILSFQSMYELYPIKTNGGGVFSFMLFGDKDKPETWQQNTSFQKRMKEFLVNGGKTHENGGIILPCDIIN
ncbi:MAG: hypothetical protein E7665_03870 [Ruminococcaceae bacterium]|nr:hypothetical protein [Oscillospiraceae bacterium]